MAWHILIINWCQLEQFYRPETEHVSAISDELLIDIAGKIGEKDWTPLARELGFTKQEIREVKRQNPHRSREQIYQVLILWRQKLGREATVAALEQSLSNSGMQTWPASDNLESAL